MSTSPRSRRRTLGVRVLATAGLGLVATGSWILYLPDDAAPASRPSAAVRARTTAGAASLPRVLINQDLRPPRAFDVLKHPQTTGVGLLIRTEVGGWPGLYGTDVATGALVRLHDLPGTGGRTGPHWPDDVAVSPDGHLLSDGVRVVDLRTATVRAIATAAPAKTASPETVSVFNDGMVLTVSTSGQLWRYPPPGGRAPAAVAGLRGVTSVRAQADRRALVTGANGHRPLAILVDPVGDVPSVFPLPGLSPDQPAAEVNGTILHPTAKGGLEVRGLRRDRPESVPGLEHVGRVHDLAFGPFLDGGRATAVVLGTGGKGTLALRQAPGLSPDPTEPVTELTRIPTSGDRALARTTRVTLAAEVVAAPAILVDFPPEPWWAPLAGPHRPTGALILIGLGVLIVLPLAVRRLSNRPARTHPARNA